MALVIIILLILIITGLFVYNLSISKKIENFSNLNQKITNLNILQDFMNTISEVTSVNEKFQKINNILIERYSIKYSTIVIYNGTEYEIKASNVEKKHWDTLKSLQNEKIFTECIQSAIPKYVTVEKEGERLPYQKMEFERAKSAIFFPLYIENVYVGYWIIEGSRQHEFDNVDTTILEVIKNNIVSVLKTVQNQQVLENIVREDKFTKLKSAEYLFGEGKKTIDKYTTSTVCLFRITNLEEINEKYGREMGNKTVTIVSDEIGKNLSSEYIFVRYMGPKFVIVFSGIEIETIVNFMKQVKEQIDNIKIDNSKEISPKINIVLSTYYKGTALEGLTKKLEEYIDTAEKEENTINYL